MWRVPTQQQSDCISTELRLRSGPEEGDKHAVQTSAVRPHVPTPHSFVQLSQRPQLARVQSAEAPSLNSGMRWDSIHTATISRAPRYTASQRLAVKEQVLKAFDEAEEQIELNKRMLKALNDAHTQYHRLKKIFRKGEERWMMEARTYQNRELESQAKIAFLENRERELQHQLMINQKVMKAIRMHETFAFTKTDIQNGANFSDPGANCPKCTCPHCKKSIHDVVDLSDSDEDALKHIKKV